MSPWGNGMRNASSLYCTRLPERTSSCTWSKPMRRKNVFRSAIHVIYYFFFCSCCSSSLIVAVLKLSTNVFSNLWLSKIACRLEFIVTNCLTCGPNVYRTSAATLGRAVWHQHQHSARSSNFRSVASWVEAHSVTPWFNFAIRWDPGFQVAFASSFGV